MWMTKMYWHFVSNENILSRHPDAFNAAIERKSCAGRYCEAARAVTVKLLARHTREDNWPTHQFRKKRASYDRQSGLGLLLQ